MFGAAPATLPVSVDPTLIEILMSPWLRLAAFVWGTLWGSFANVVIHRLPAGLSVARPRSRCPGCETPIAWYDNIPILSYLLLRGRCRKCEEPVALRYLLVELLGGLLSFALFMLHVITPLLEGGGIEGLIVWQIWFFFCLALVVITFTDLDLWIIPNEVVLGMSAIGAVLVIWKPELLGVETLPALAAGVGGLALIAAIRWLYMTFRDIEAIGLGDGKLLLMIGIFGGPMAVAWTLGAGAIQGLLVSIPMLLAGSNPANTELTEVHGDDPELGEEDPDAGVMGRRVPFGPFLALAGLEWVLLRGQIEALFAWLTGAVS
ncbi:Type 4 prepilin-like proteins leader peptide-processing enzyme [Enhygromyxa salina]|uniref:Type 4 prepilin-like proteins leader peptide-processing enzyme n=1 Tax=Enhygromyxa salina TaxID=215803 RepID=A0A2S9XKP5_9BACT|nr:A24 family peptidase [Enhygromyxa salina]PRP93407.1 Type 4 prepilin-like proteins leader peptide-processing enzyme [Enhygromyxa salina]